MARKPTKRLTKKPVKKEAKSNSSYFDKIETEVTSNQSRLSMVLGILIILVVGILVYNYFQKGNSSSLGPASQTEQQQAVDVSVDNLPGKYTVKEGDTLFLIAEKYYQDGNKFTEIAKANNLSNVNTISKGQVLEIPKLAEEVAQASTSPSPSPSASPTMAPSPSPSEQPIMSPEPSSSPEPTAVPDTSVSSSSMGTGTGGANTTIWGPRIEGNTYTVVEGDWLSKIAGRAYGDITLFQKIAKVNHIKNPDLIFPGQVLVIPR